MFPRLGHDRLRVNVVDDNFYTYYQNGLKKIDGKEIDLDIKEVIEDLKLIESKVNEQIEAKVENPDYKKITSLHLIDCQLNDEDISLLAEYLKDDRSITSLKLNRNLITDKGVEVLVDLLNVNKTIKHFEMNFNRHTKSGAAFFIENITEIPVVDIECSENPPQTLIENTNEQPRRDIYLSLTSGACGSIQWNADCTPTEIANVGRQAKVTNYVPSLLTLSWFAFKNSLTPADIEATASTEIKLN